MDPNTDPLDAALLSLAETRRELDALAAAVADDLTEVRIAVADLERRRGSRS